MECTSIPLPFKAYDNDDEEMIELEPLLQVIDKGIEYYSEALTRGMNLVKLVDKGICSGLCHFFKYHGYRWFAEILSDELNIQYGDRMHNYVFIAPTAIEFRYSREERFALRLKILKNLKKSLEAL